MTTLTTDTSRASTRTRTRFAVAVAALLLAPAILTACSSDKPDSAPSPERDTASAFFSCMRDKGYDVPDPTADQKSVSLEVPDGVDPSQYRDDMAGCAKSSGAGDAAAQPLPGAGKEWEKTVSCVREHGFPDFPDDMDAAASFAPADTSTYEDVLETCSTGEAAGASGAE